MKSGFVNIFGKPNAGKSTLLNALLGEKLAIVSSKVQTTRHRIKGFLNKKDEYQIILSDTPGIIEPKYKLHQKMMGNVKSALEDADVAVLLVDILDDWQACVELFNALRLKVPCIVAINKIDKADPAKVKEAKAFFGSLPYCKKVVTLSAINQTIFEKLIHAVVDLLPEGMAFYDEDELTDLPTKFFVGELIREKIYQLFQDEIPYHTAVMVNTFKEKSTLIKIQADIIVQRETQKMILIGEKGNMIKKIGTLAREDIEKFLEQKVFLELFVKVRPKWRENDAQLKEYGYN
ncbi:GTP-binding protein Era [Arachidicoccus rhizosphaerae]|uniref:GTPase Era n=1 Tax=Arachidicoccus rhizosphaerae TaxID=551991 RepID=A0A1H3W8C7_9BACT|nr:GTPase Era [Arachidicoccus rhizosphaerae]SDZ83389.1 GTP-binding protein Era [Arachidicoccus rhizosphaerae]